MKKMLLISLTLGTLVTLYAENVKYPQEYKEWKHIKKMIIKPEHPMGDIFHGIHHIYANDKAYDGYKKGKFEDGSIIALDFLNYEDINATISETSRIYVAVMQKSTTKYKSTHGWGYEAFKGNTEEKLVVDIQKICVNCHESQVKNNYIFSKIRK
jgi:hypothetical protein